MYNRYIRNDRGTYTRIPEEEARPAAPRPEKPPRPEDAPPPDSAPRPEHAPPPRDGPPPQGVPPETPRMEDTPSPDRARPASRNFFHPFRLDHADSGDFLLLGLLFLLFREEADEETLAALGLLLIL